MLEQDPPLAYSSYSGNFCCYQRGQSPKVPGQMPNPYISLIFSVKLSVSNLKPSVETLPQLKLVADHLIFHVDESKGLWPKAVALKGRVVGRAGSKPVA